MDLTNIKRHTNLLAKRVKTLIESIQEAKEEKNMGMHELDIKDIKHNLYMVEVQLERLENFMKAGIKI